MAANAVTTVSQGTVSGRREATFGFSNDGGRESEASREPGGLLPVVANIVSFIHDYVCSLCSVNVRIEQFKRTLSRIAVVAGSVSATR